MIDYDRTIMSQYATSPTLLSLLRSFNDWLDPTADLQAFYDLVWNLDTAQGYGLDVWGRIVNVRRTITVPLDVTYFGFVTGVRPEAYAVFNQGPMYVPGHTDTTNFVLTDDAYRRLIYLKALANISTCSIPVLNGLLQTLFEGRGRCYVSDLGNMAMRYTFEFVLTTVEVSLIANSGVLARPTGVQASVLQIPPGKTFGFAEMGHYAAPFNVGAFVNHTPVVGLVDPLGEVVVRPPPPGVDTGEGVHVAGPVSYP